jgi:hypothetical protein
MGFARMQSIVGSVAKDWASVSSADINTAIPPFQDNNSTIKTDPSNGSKWKGTW